MIVARHLQRWKPITGGSVVCHTYVSFTLKVCVYLSALTFSLDLLQFKWVYGCMHLCVIVKDSEKKYCT